MARGGGTWFVFESVDRRAEKSLSDLKGTDMYVHDGTPDGVFREIGNAMVGSGRHVTIEDQRRVFNALRDDLPEVMAQFGAKTCFEANVFWRLRLLASLRVDNEPPA